MSEDLLEQKEQLSHKLFQLEFLIVKKTFTQWSKQQLRILSQPFGCPNIIYREVKSIQRTETQRVQ